MTSCWCAGAAQIGKGSKRRGGASVGCVFGNSAHELQVGHSAVWRLQLKQIQHHAQKYLCSDSGTFNIEQSRIRLLHTLDIPDTAAWRRALEVDQRRCVRNTNDLALSLGAST